ncbi:helix-turn-helix domain-containing protein [Pseudoalteromonas luteoviolacea]|uniref:HTH cro/C1-type domain-containing protein n=1 Tax=Pseudoalteromonas luteoviolacea NCIMB 1942 TaxID=1365253 RepID=A0A167B0E9_9GAMM|nr:helix-turn-helix transcriptional regulator [Pseudoalteromonas luteoviolacea]KZN46014.1 hypothetical protein N482_13145 [Pseudoalteromonas luteoviolacea NCIMB 1942]
MKQPAWVQPIQAVMKKKGVKQRDLMSVFNVNSQGAVSHYFSGRNKLSDKQMTEFADFLGISKSTFFQDEPKDEHQLDTNSLTEAFQTLARLDELSDGEITSFFNVYEKMGPDRIAEVYDVLYKINKSKQEQLSTTIHTLKKAP